MRTTRFFAQIKGSNGSKAHAFAVDSGVEVFAQTHDSTDWHTLLVANEYDEDGFEGYLHPPALFATREEARAAASAAHWSNQSYRVIPARGRARAAGVLVSVAEWASCQDGGGR